MEKGIIKEVEKAYGVNSSHFELLGGFDNNVFLSQEKNIVIKFLDTMKYSEEMIEQEILFARLMADKGIKTADPLKSMNGNKVEFFKGSEKDYYTNFFF